MCIYGFRADNTHTFIYIYINCNMGIVIIIIIIRFILQRMYVYDIDGGDRI